MKQADAVAADGLHVGALAVRDGLTPHGLRHSRKTWMAEDGIQLTFSSTFAGVALTACSGGVDVVVVRRQPRNPLGWLLISFVLLAGLSVDAGFLRGR